MQLRLDKYLADAGFGTRTAVKALIRSKRVQVNGKPAGPEQKVDPEADQVTVDGKPAGYNAYEYYILNKPAGVLSASRDKKEKTVIDLIPEPKRRDLFPVGRLDRDTVGLLLITNDGQLSHRLLSPGKHVSKVYRVLIQGELPENAAELTEQGLEIGDEEPAAPARLHVVGEASPARVRELLERYGLDPEALLREAPNLTETEITLTEGRFHEVKRIFAALGCEVMFLQRLSMGTLTLPPELGPGESMPLTGKQLDFIR